MLEQLVGDSQALDRAIAGEELSSKDGLELMNYDNLHLLGAVADATRKKLVDDTVSIGNNQNFHSKRTGGSSVLSYRIISCCVEHRFL